MSIVQNFMNKVISIYKTGESTENSYRSAIETLFSELDDDIRALNEPKRIKCGAPDFIVHRGDIVIGHVEAKDIDVDLRAMKGTNKNQKDRYLNALPNLIYTNCLDWDFYRDGDLIASVSIAEFSVGIQPTSDQYSKLESLLRNFITQHPISITSPRDLAVRMAGKAQLIKDVFYNALNNDISAGIESDLTEQYETFKEYLINDITAEDFADIYAETICYGMFAARLHDHTLDTFSRHEALDKLPKTNPFLRNLFTYIAGPGLDERIMWIIDDLTEIFRATNVAKIMEGFGKLTGRNDPFLHFYETFLSAYNPEKRKSRGVWYTPEPVVNFIVRSVDYVLQNELEITEGLADTSRVSIMWDTGQRKLTKKGKPTKDGKNAFIEKNVHRVQILDPATGTGTFLAEVIKMIAPKVKKTASGMWSSYIENDLIPRIHGFEILMASYAMCHMKLDMVLTELGYKPSKTPPRQSVYLTNSLEEGDPPDYTLPFARWLSEEVKMANSIKRDMPIMCVIGNPPYSGISQNMGEWITNLIEDYKYVDGRHFGERKHWLQDDYVKFIRSAEDIIEKNGKGVLGFITNHGYLDNPTFRGMRWHLLNTFDKIWVLDLHGNYNKKELTPEGKPDSNIFDIRQGVAILIAIKKKHENNDLAKVMHGELWGGRDSKYETLENLEISDALFESIECPEPRFPFVPRDMAAYKSYQLGFAIDELMTINTTGVVTARDSLVIDFNAQKLKNKIDKFVDPKKTDEQVRSEFFPTKKSGKYPPGDSRGWKLPAARASLKNSNWMSDITQIAYRPFDIRYILYRPDMVDWGRFNFMQYTMMQANNIALVTPRIKKKGTGALVATHICGHKMYDAYDSNSLFPLYLFNEDDQSHSVNFNTKIYYSMQKLATHPEYGIPDEIAIFDYIYGILHCPAYHVKFAEYLKSDFPRIPWPVTADEFWDVSSRGTTLRKLHLMDVDVIGDTPFPFEGEGDNTVHNLNYKDNKIWINKGQYFSEVPEISWNLYIGGYQPAQKWLKDRKYCALDFDDVRHYQRILKILAETDRIMRTIELSLA